MVAVDALLDAHAPLDLLIACAIEGEGLGARSAHPDNIAPALCGGFVLVRHPDPPDIVRLPVPAGLMAVVVHPDLEIETAKARALLGTTVPLADAIRQWANLGALVDGLHRADFALISRALEDTIAEPRRASLVPGPGGRSSRRRSMRARSAAACRDRARRSSRCAAATEVARRVADAMTRAVKAHIGGEPQTYVSSIAPQGARVVSSCAS